MRPRSVLLFAAALLITACGGADGEAALNDVVLAGNPGLKQAMLDEGFPAPIAEQFGSVQTGLVTSEPGHYRFRQLVPAFSMARDVEIRLDEADLEVPADAVPLETSRGFKIYPLRLEVEAIPEGFVLHSEFFIPPGELTAEEIAALGLHGPKTALLSPALTLISFAYADSTPGIVVEGAVVTSNAGSNVAGSGNSGTFIRPPDTPAPVPANPRPARAIPTTPLPARPARGFWENIPYWERGPTREPGEWARQELWRQGRGTDREIEQALQAQNQKALRRLTAPVAAGFALWEMYSAAKDWWNADDELKALEKCAAKPTSRLAQRARTEDPEYARATTERLAETRTELNINTVVRGVNVGADYAASHVGGPLGLATMVLTGANEAMLAEVHRGIMRDAGKGVVRCGPQYVAAEIRYSYSLTFTNDPPERGTPNDHGSVTEVLNGKLVFSVDSANGEVDEGSGWGEYRHTESGGYACVTYSDKTSGSVAMWVGGSPAGLGKFNLSLNAEGTGLETKGDPHQGMDNDRCTARPGYSSKDGGASVVCYFEDVPVLEGGSFFSTDDFKDGSDPNYIESRSCRLDLKPLNAKPPVDPENPPPPPARPIDAKSRCSRRYGLPINK